MVFPAPPPVTPITTWSSTGVGRATQAAFRPADLAKDGNVGTGRLQVAPPMTINRVMGIQALDKVHNQGNASSGKHVVSWAEMYTGSAMR
jgi:2-methylcitrate dehydratase PrpD